MKPPIIRIGQGAYTRDITPEPGLDIVGVILEALIFIGGVIAGAIIF